MSAVKDIVLVVRMRALLYTLLAVGKTTVPAGLHRSTAPSPCFTLLYAVDRCRPSTAGLQVYSLQRLLYRLQQSTPRLWSRTVNPQLWALVPFLLASRLHARRNLFYVFAGECEH